MKFKVGDVVRAIINTGTYSIGDEFIVTVLDRRISIVDKYIEYIGFECDHPDRQIRTGLTSGFKASHFEFAKRRSYISKRPKNLPNLERKDTV